MITQQLAALIAVAHGVKVGLIIEKLMVVYYIVLRKL
jgi:hypothetical protein